MSKRNTPPEEGITQPETAAVDESQQPSPAPTETAKAVKVRVIVEKGTLGPELLVFGDVTEHPDYVALLDIKGQKKVEKVK